jgi:hypothetical protein
MAPAAQQVLEESSFEQTQGQKTDFLRPPLATRQPVKSDGKFATQFIAQGLDAPARE